jgi:hypothetical protein
VLGAALCLILSSLFIFRNSFSFGQRFSTLQNPPIPRNKIGPDQAPEIATAMEKLRAPQQWNATGRLGLFVPEKHFIGSNGEPARLQDTLLHPPVPNEWLEEFGLPITDPEVLTEDPDNDGFNNLDEWEGHTNPAEKGSHPPYPFKLKLRSYAEEAFPLIFSSYIGEHYAINNTDPGKPTQFLRLGEAVKGTKYKLKEYVEEFEVDKYGTWVDVSELVLEQVETHGLVRLVKEKRASYPESVANFIYTWGGTEEVFAVKKEQEFSLNPQPEIKYKLEDVKPEKAIIINLQKPGEKIEIGLAMP